MIVLVFFLPKKFYQYLIAMREAEWKFKFNKKWLSNIPYHVGVRIDSFYFEADYSGVTRVKYYKMIESLENNIIEIDISKDLPKKMAFKNYIRGLWKSKVKYDYSGLFHHIFPFLKQDKRKKYCSEMIADGLRKAGYPLYKTKITPYRLFKIILFNKLRDELKLTDVRALDIKTIVENNLWTKCSGELIHS